MAENRRKPLIRFKGFTDDWEQRKLGDIANKITEKNTDMAFNETLTNSAEFGIISQMDFFDHSISKANKIHGYTVVRKDYFVYNPRISVTAPVGPINRNRLGREGVMSPLYTVFSTHDIDATFLEWSFKNNSWHKFMKFNGDSGARSDRFSIKDDVFFRMPILAPKDKDHIEQKCIGKFFEQLDHVITLHQRKLDKLLNIKKSMLDKMFPKKCSKKPEIRFKGFTDDWEQRKLSEITDVRDGTHDSPHYQSFGYPFITSKNVKNGFINYDDIQYISEADFEEINKRSKVDVNDILMGMIGTIGNMALIRKEPDFAIKNVALIKDTKQVNYLYLYHFLHSKFVEKQLSSGMDGGTQKFIALGNIRNLDILFPSEKEQRRIGVYFEDIDHHITLHQRKLEKLKNLKKACLDKMFV